MKRWQIVFGVTALFSSMVLAADRLTDRDLKTLIERIDDGRDKFEDALSDQTKHSIFRGSSGEVNVDKFLHDFKENIDHLKDRLKPEYAASAEAATVLRQGAAIDRFFQQQPAGTKGASEWGRLSTDLKTLAGVYGAEWPVSDSTPVRRIGDQELATAVKGVASAAEQVKKSIDGELKKDPTIARQARQDAEAMAADVQKSAKALCDRIDDREPSAAQADQLLAAASRMQAFLGGRPALPSASVWNGAGARLQTVADAYRMAWPR